MLDQKATGKLISLANLVEFNENGSAKKLARYNRQRAVTISANISRIYTLTEAIAYLEETMEEIGLLIKLHGKVNQKK